jgi:hypothetical protein
MMKLGVVLFRRIAGILSTTLFGNFKVFEFEIYWASVGSQLKVLA